MLHHETKLNMIPYPNQKIVEWIKKEACKYSDDGIFKIMMDGKMDIPANTVLTVSPCFDIEDVKKYLENPNYENFKMLVIKPT